MNRICSVLFTLLTAGASASTVCAQSATQTHTATLTNIPLFGWGIATMPNFDPALGILRSVKLRIVGSVSGTFSLENTNSTMTGNGVAYLGARFHAPMPFLLYGPMGFAYYETASQVPAPPDMAPFDGALDFQGPSSTTYAFAGSATPGTPYHLPDNTYGPITGGGLNLFLGPAGAPGTREIMVYVDPSQSIFLPQGVEKTLAMTAEAQVTLEYAYDPLPTAFCLPALTSCPCFPSLPQAPDRGCPNSSTSGARLDFSGVASISADTLSLQAAFMPDGPALFFQGTAYQFVPNTLGDGLMCISGGITRLGVKFNVGGASTYPSAGDASMSVQGAVVLPSERFYQVYYRDAVPHCGSGTMNLSNGIAVRWQP